MEKSNYCFYCAVEGQIADDSGDAQFPALASPTVEPQFLVQVFLGQSDPFDQEMAHLCKREHSTDAELLFYQAGGFYLLYYKAYSGSLQLVISGCSLRELLMHELYCSVISAHLRAYKTIWALY